MKDVANGKIPSDIADVQAGELTSSGAQEVSALTGEQSSFFTNAAGYIAVEGAFENLKQNVAATEAMKIVMEQLETSFMGYETTVVSLNLARHRKEMIRMASAEEFTHELEERLSEGLLIRADKALEADPQLRLTLLATPNIQVNPGSLKDAVKALSFNKLTKPYVDTPLYDKYSGIQVSGTNPTNHRLFQFAFMPSKPTKGMRGEVVTQRANLESRKFAYQKVPSMLEAFVYWKTLWAQGMLEKPGPELDQITRIRHFDLVEQPLDSLLFVPQSFISEDGNPRLAGSDARTQADARLLLV